MSYNWLDHWEKNDIAFHQLEGNPLLKEFWSGLQVPVGSTVLVPLCGKTVDMLWLMQQGYHVIGVELSEIACKDFFTENNLPFEIKKRDDFTRYFNDKIEIFCGDFFALTKELMPPIEAVYDRAAFIALSNDLRQRYAAHLINLMAPKSKMFLIVYNSSDTVEGPPFPISRAEIDKKYGKDFQIKEVISIERKTILPHLHEKGYRELTENVYYLNRSNNT